MNVKRPPEDKIPSIAEQSKAIELIDVLFVKCRHLLIFMEYILELS